MIWTNFAFGSCYLGLNLHVIGLESRQKWIWDSIQQFFFCGLGHDLGSRLGLNLVGLNEALKARRSRSGPRIENSFIKRAASGPRVRVWKNLAQTQSIAILRSGNLKITWWDFCPTKSFPHLSTNHHVKFIFHCI